MIIRTAIESDIPSLAKLYSDSVKAIAPQQYSPAQVQMWASFSAETESFRKFILEPITFVAEENNILLGFSGVTNQGHLASIYVHGDYHRQGIGSKLLEKVLEYAQINKIKRLYSEASEFSKPLFEKFGFETYDQEKVERNGVLFTRYLMQRSPE